MGQKKVVFQEGWRPPCKGLRGSPRLISSSASNLLCDPELVASPFWFLKSWSLFSALCKNSICWSLPGVYCGVVFLFCFIFYFFNFFNWWSGRGCDPAEVRNMASESAVFPSNRGMFWGSFLGWLTLGIVAKRQGEGRKKFYCARALAGSCGGVHRNTLLPFVLTENC